MLQSVTQKSGRAFNFSAGPAALPESVLQIASAEMLNWHSSGMSVMEMSHRGTDFISICEQTQSLLRELLSIPTHFKILFMQGGGLAENAIVPLNLAMRLPHKKMDFVVTGSWSQKSQLEAQRYGDASIAAHNIETNFTSLPDPSSWKLRQDASYVHICSNETINGIEFQELPDIVSLGSDAPLVIDCSSHILSRSINWSRVGLAYAGAQKNIGPAGLTIVIIREDLVGHAMAFCPSAFDYQIVATNNSMFNTPPTYSIYIAGLVFQWLKAKGGIAMMEKENIAKAKLLYDFLDTSSLYDNRVEKKCRSRMNVPFYLRDERLNDQFLNGAKALGLLQLKGHKSVGGMRASIYNAMPLEGVQALVNYLGDFERNA